VLSDMSSLYTDIGGAGSVVAAQMAVADSGIEKRGYKVEIVSADHQNKPDVGSAIARQWYDVDKVDVIVDVPNSGVALAVNQITRDKGKAFLISGAASSDLTGKACSPNSIHWTYDTWMLANGTGGAIVKAGGDTWFFLTADYAFGLALERDTEAVVLKNGGKVLGKVRHPLNTQDFSSFLLQAQASKAKIIGLANAGGDTTNAIKGAAEFHKERGNHIVTAQTEHKAVLDTCKRLEKEGFEVTYLPVAADGRVTPDSVRGAITDKTILVSIMLANNEIGTVNPVDEIGAAVKERGVLFHIDAVQGVGKIPFDVNSSKADLVSLSLTTDDQLRETKKKLAAAPKKRLAGWPPWKRNVALKRQRASTPKPRADARPKKPHDATLKRKRSAGRKQNSFPLNHGEIRPDRNAVDGDHLNGLRHLSIRIRPI